MENDGNSEERLVLDDFDVLIADLETRFEDSELLKGPTMVGTSGCTDVYKCTGSCPCGGG
ncbi:hypothetical protein [Streptomyces sp. NPDC001415]